MVSSCGITCLFLLFLDWIIKGLERKNGIRFFFIGRASIRYGADGDPSAKLSGGVIISPVITVRCLYKGNERHARDTSDNKRRQHNANRHRNKKKKLTNVLVKDLQPASEWNSIDPTSRLMNLNFGNCVINDPSAPLCRQQQQHTTSGLDSIVT